MRAIRASLLVSLLSTQTHALNNIFRSPVRWECKIQSIRQDVRIAMLYVTTNSNESALSMRWWHCVYYIFILNIVQMWIPVTRYACWIADQVHRNLELMMQCCITEPSIPTKLCKLINNYALPWDPFHLIRWRTHVSPMLPSKSICCSTALPLEFARAPAAHTGFYALRIAHRDSRSVRAIVRSDARVRVCSLIKHSRSLVRRGTYKMLVVCLTCSG